MSEVITNLDELEAAAFAAMQSRFQTQADLQMALGVSQGTARNYFKGLVASISKEHLFDIADKLNIPYKISNQE